MLVGLRSRRQIAPFTLHCPTSLAEAAAERTANSAFLAGGMDLIDRLKYGEPLERLIRLDRVRGLSDISGGPDLLRIGAMATHAAIADSALLHDVLPDLAMIWRGIANPRVRFAGTIGGNVMSRRGEYDAMPALLALGAEAEVAADHGTHRVPLDRLVMLDDPLLASFVIKLPRALRLFAERSLRPAVAVWLGLTVEAGRVSALRVAVGMAHPLPACVTLPLDVKLTELGRDAAAVAAKVMHLMPATAGDGRASAAYRRRMIGVLTERLLIRGGDQV